MKIFAQKLNVRLIFPIGILFLIIFSGCNQNSLLKKITEVCILRKGMMFDVLVRRF